MEQKTNTNTEYGQKVQILSMGKRFNEHTDNYNNYNGKYWLQGSYFHRSASNH